MNEYFKMLSPEAWENPALNNIQFKDYMGSYLTPAKMKQARYITSIPATPANSYNSQDGKLVIRNLGQRFQRNKAISLIGSTPEGIIEVARLERWHKASWEFFLLKIQHFKLKTPGRPPRLSSKALVQKDDVYLNTAEVSLKHVLMRQYLESGIDVELTSVQTGQVFSSKAIFYDHVHADKWELRYEIAKYLTGRMKSEALVDLVTKIDQNRKEMLLA